MTTIKAIPCFFCEKKPRCEYDVRGYAEYSCKGCGLYGPTAYDPDTDCRLGRYLVNPERDEFINIAKKCVKKYGKKGPEEKWNAHIASLVAIAKRKLA